MNTSRLLGLMLIVLGLAIARCVSAEPAASNPASTQADSKSIAQWIADLDSKEGTVRAAASKNLFDLNQGALEPLRQAGAKQISANGTIATRRIDIVFSLIEGLRKPAKGDRAGYSPNSFGLKFQPGVTRDQVIKLGEQYGFTLEGDFAPDDTPSCYLTLQRGKNLSTVLRDILCNEPTVISVNLNYFEA